MTYNGDYFDWPFVEKRAEKHGMNMKKEIGFVMNTANECLSRCCPHLDCMHWVNRDSYLPQGSRGLKVSAQNSVLYPQCQDYDNVHCQESLTLPFI